MKYGELFEKAWKIFWRYKVLWIFGILASCSTRNGGGGGGGNPNMNYQFNGNQNFGNIPYQNLPPQWQQFFYNLEQGARSGALWAYIAGFVAIACVIGILIWLLFLVLGTFGRVGLIRGAWLADEGAERLTFSGLWNSATHYFWRVFLFLLIFGIVIFFVWLILFIPILIFGICTFCIGFLVVWAISWLISVWLELTIVAIVGEDLDVGAGITRGWDVITHNWGPVIVVAIIIGIGTFILNLLIGLPFLLVALPIVLGIGATGRSLAAGSIAAAIAIFCVYLPIAIFLYGLVQTYVATVWTLLFRRLTGRTGEILPVPAQPVAPAPVEPVAPAEPPSAVPPEETPGTVGVFEPNKPE